MKTTHQPYLEVFPEHDDVNYNGETSPGDLKFYVRLRFGNGAKAMRSEDYDSNGSRSNAIRAARAINRITATPEFPNGRLHIRVLDEDGHVVRTIEPEQEPPFHNADSGIGDE